MALVTTRRGTIKSATLLCRRNGPVCFERANWRRPAAAAATQRTRDCFARNSHKLCARKFNAAPPPHPFRRFSSTLAPVGRRSQFWLHLSTTTFCLRLIVNTRSAYTREEKRDSPPYSMVVQKNRTGCCGLAKLTAGRQAALVCNADPLPQGPTPNVVFVASDGNCDETTFESSGVVVRLR